MKNYMVRQRDRGTWWSMLPVVPLVWARLAMIFNDVAMNPWLNLAADSQALLVLGRYREI
jgi:hypothetical protein